jgi:hypothetical protein
LAFDVDRSEARLRPTGRCTLVQARATGLGGTANLTARSDRTQTTDLAERSIERLESHLLAEEFRGWDPYDALSSPVFRLPVLRSSKWIRIAAEQALKRSAYNLRPLLRIPKGYNPVTLAFVLEGSAYRALAEPDRAALHRARAVDCVSELARVQSRGYSGACWGYDFDWEARYGRLPAATPTIVATGIVTNALFNAHTLLGLEGAFGLCESAARFVLEDLPRASAEDGTFCWGYYPSDGQRVLNATMKGARLCAQVYSVTGDGSYLEPAARTVAYVSAQQRPDGSWPYAVGDRRTWADNFHTAYILDALDSYERCTGDSGFRSEKQRGWKYYREGFFRDGCIPKYYVDEAYPVDATACAQSILTLCRFDDVDTASRVAAWTIRTMQCPDGHFAYQVRRRRVVRIPYMRWSSAYMYSGLSKLLYALVGGVDGR